MRLIKKGVNALNDILNKPEEKSADNLNYLEYLVMKHKSSQVRTEQVKGVDYYKGKHDILNKKRTVIGENGDLETVGNLPNNIRIDNQYALAVDKKVNYLLGRKATYTVDDESDSVIDEINNILNDSFNRRLKNILKDSLNCGIAYLYVYVSDAGELSFKRLPSYECYPVWIDDEHTEMDFLIRIYTKKEFINGGEVENEYVEVYSTTKLKRYKLKGKSLIQVSDEPYISDQSGNVYNWGKTPVIAFKYNDEEISLLKRVKELQDGINEILSTFNDHMDENPRNSILVLHNYDGQKLDEFRHNLNTYGAVKVKNDGGVSVLNVEVNSNNYLSILSIFKNALIENAKSYDAKDDRMSGNPNQMNIQSMYSDIDLDANGIETEFSASFEQLSNFIRMYLASARNVHLKETSTVNIIFNKDVLINESQVISDIRNSSGIISSETMIENHPYIDDVAKELERIDAEKQKAIEDMAEEEYQSRMMSDEG